MARIWQTPCVARRKPVLLATGPIWDALGARSRIRQRPHRPRSTCDRVVDAVARRPTRLRAAQRVAIFSAAKPRAHRRAVWRWPRRSCTDHRRHDRAPTRTVTRQRQSRLTATASKALALLPKAARSLLPSKLRNSNAAPKEHYDRQPLQATKARRENLANRDGTAAHGSHGHDREIQRPRSTNSPPFWAASERRNSFSNSPIAMV